MYRPAAVDVPLRRALRTQLAGSRAHNVATQAWDTVLRRADEALYEAKRLGKNRVESA